MLNPSCYGFIIKSNTDKYLLVETLNGRYGFPKGKRHKGELPFHCAVRELTEETGLTLDQIQVLSLTPVKEINEKGNCPTAYYQATINGEPSVMCYDTEENLKPQWLSLDDINKLTDLQLRSRRRKLINQN